MQKCNCNQWLDIETAPQGEAILAIDDAGEIVLVEIDKTGRAEIIILGDINNDYPACSKWMPLPKQS